MNNYTGQDLSHTLNTLLSRPLSHGPQIAGSVDGGDRILQLGEGKSADITRIVSRVLLAVTQLSELQRRKLRHKLREGLLLPPNGDRVVVAETRVGGGGGGARRTGGFVYPAGGLFSLLLSLVSI